MTKFRLTVNQPLLEQWRSVPMRAQRLFRRKLVTVLGPELQTEVDLLMIDPPGPVSEPFAFGSEASKRYYFWLVNEYPELTDGHHWRRTELLESHWRVEVSDRLRGNQVTVSNILRESTGTEPFPGRYVYGPWAVQGHINTGWPEQMEVARQRLQEKFIERAKEMWSEAVDEALKGRDA